MGEVYLSQDTRLDRQVAIKVLPESLQTDPERLARFRYEAKAAGSLKHPNIATIYALEESDDLSFIVMEYVEGETLSDHISKERMERDFFFSVFMPLADALAHAHDNGRIHRDLKPGNIMIATEGTPKILDFGLARIERNEATPQTHDSQAPTMTMDDALAPSLSHLTHTGAFLGTPSYMSPEQIEGKKIDRRTDLFFFRTGDV